MQPAAPILTSLEYHATDSISPARASHAAAMHSLKLSFTKRQHGGSPAFDLKPAANESGRLDLKAATN
jgi:hypothetical protein